MKRVNDELVRIIIELLKDNKEQLNDQAKNLIIEQARKDESRTIKLSVLLSDELDVDYKALSQLFSKNENKTIEKYYLAQRAEYIKELIDYNELTISEIAYKLGYSSVAHLSDQFKQTTGMTPTQYKNDATSNRRSIGSICLIL